METNKPKIIDTIWFGKIGIVKYWNGFELKYYIGVGFGIDEQTDTKQILDFGSTFVLPKSFYSLLNK